jgi:hypothetical protein
MAEEISVDVTITRDSSFNGSLIPCYVYCDEKNVGVLHPGETIQFKVSPGLHTFKTDRQPGGNNWIGLGCNIRPFLKPITVNANHPLMLRVKNHAHLTTCTFDLEGNEL